MCIERAFSVSTDTFSRQMAGSMLSNVATSVEQSMPPPFVAG